MKGIVFASDLDNTLLYSRSHKREGDVCVEHIKGEAHGFMTPLAIERLREVSQKVRLIPVTTRSVEQYRRIEWPEGTAPEYAVTTNGAVLLHGGEVDAAWREAHYPAATTSPHAGAGSQSESVYDSCRPSPDRSSPERP